MKPSGKPNKGVVIVDHPDTKLHNRFLQIYNYHSNKLAGKSNAQKLKLAEHIFYGQQRATINYLVAQQIKGSGARRAASTILQRYARRFYKPYWAEDKRPDFENVHAVTQKMSDELKAAKVPVGVVMEIFTSIHDKFNDAQIHVTPLYLRRN